MDRPPPPHLSPKGIWVTKLIFRVLSAIFSIVIIGLAAATSTQAGGLYDYGYGYSLFALPIIVLGPPAAVGFIWDVAEGICIIARRGHRGIHPGAIVALDLLLWLGFIAGAVWFGLYNIYDLDYYDSYYYDDDYYDEYEAILGISRAALAFSILEIVLHLTLFIFGCYETSIRNRSPPPIIIYPGAPPMGPVQPHPYGQQPLILPVGQAPPAGYVPYAYGPTQPQPVHQAPKQEYYAPEGVSPPPQEPSPIHTNSTPVNGGDWRNSYQPPSNSGHHDTAYVGARD